MLPNQLVIQRQPGACSLGEAVDPAFDDLARTLVTAFARHGQAGWDRAGWAEL